MPYRSFFLVVLSLSDSSGNYLSLLFTSDDSSTFGGDSFRGFGDSLACGDFFYFEFTLRLFYSSCALNLGSIKLSWSELSSLTLFELRYGVTFVKLGLSGFYAELVGRGGFWLSLKISAVGFHYLRSLF